MYIVNIINNNSVTEIHGYDEHLRAGTLIKGINTIDSFSFTLFPTSKGFDLIFDKKTLVTVYNTIKNKFEFYGRVLCSKKNMSESGLITKEVTCESYLGFLCDSKQKYVEEKNWTVRGLLEHIINQHNKQVETYKQFVVGQITVTDPNDNIYVGIQRENTWNTLGKKLADTLGGEISFRVENNTIYIDYLKTSGKICETPIQISKNMKSISKDEDSLSYISRLIPLGCKLSKEETITDENGNIITQTTESEERLDITSVNNGVEYIEDEDALDKFGVCVDYVTFDDVTEPQNLLSKGKAYLAESNRTKIKYVISALDLSLIGLDIDGYEVGNYYPIINPMLNINDITRITKKAIDVCNEVKSTIEVGESFKSLTEIQLEQLGKVDTVIESVKQEVSKREIALKNLANRLSNSSGVYITQSIQNDGSVIYYMHNKTNLSDSDIVWKMTAEAFGISTDGGKTYPYILDVSGTAVLNRIYTVGLDASYINTGTLTAKDSEGNIVFSVNVDTGEIVMNASNIKMQSNQTVEEAIKENAKAIITAESNANKATDEKLQGYSTTTQMNAAIKAASDSIELSASKTYATQQSVVNNYNAAVQAGQNAANTAEINANNATNNKLLDYLTTAQVKALIKIEADKIALKVSANEVESIIEQKASSIRLKADKIAWSSTYSSMTSDGKLTCQSASILGDFETRQTYGTSQKITKLIEGVLKGYKDSTQYGLLDLSAVYDDKLRHAVLKGFDYLHLQAGTEIEIENKVKFFSNTVFEDGANFKNGVIVNAGMQVNDGEIKGYKNGTQYGLLNLAAGYSDGLRHVTLKGFDYLHLQAGTKISIEKYTEFSEGAAFGGKVEFYTPAKMYNLSHVTSGGHLVFATDGQTLAYLASSSRRYKDHDRDMTDDDAKALFDMPVVWFKYKDGYLSEKDRFVGKAMPGFYAEDMLEVMPEAVVYNQNGEAEDWNHRILIPVMEKQIQILYREIMELKNGVIA